MQVFLRRAAKRKAAMYHRGDDINFDVMRRRDFVTTAAVGAAGLGAGKLISDRRWAGTLAGEQARNQELERRALPEHARMTFSQQGEDIILFHVIQDLLRVERATYIDVG